MFQILTGFPEDVLAVSATGRITAEDYDTVLAPAVEAKMRAHRPLKAFFYLGPEFEGLKAGAMVEDLRLGLSHFRDWGRIAVVTDKAAMRDTVNLFAMFMRQPLKVFFNADYDKAKAWIEEREAEAA